MALFVGLCLALIIDRCILHSVLFVCYFHFPARSRRSQTATYGYIVTPRAMA